MTRSLFLSGIAALVVVAASSIAQARPFTDPRSDRTQAIDADAKFAAEPRDPACYASVLASTGGELPRSPNTLVVRWTGFSNFELVYNNQIVLLDAYFDRGAMFPPLGFKAADVKKAHAILIGHGHFDHMSDAAPIAQRTHAKVYGAPITIETAVKLGLPQDQGVVVAGGETLKFDGVTVDAALAQHSSLKREVLEEMGKLYDLDAGPATPEQAAAEKAIRDKGTFAPDVITKGTIAYAFTFDTGFKLLWIDSAGPVTDGDRALAQKLGPVDVAIIAYQGHPVAEVQIPYTLELIKLFKPRLYLPAHHDEIFGTFVDLGIEPLFEAIADALPGTKTLAPLHRRPICLDISKTG